jgi:uroporphyrinogen-III synthase
VTPVILYQRVMPNVKIQPLCDVIICTSFTAVDHLKKMVGEGAWHTLQNIPLIVMSERIKTLAHDLGFRTIWVTKNASHLAIMETIAQKRNEICQKKQISKP